MVKMIMKVSLLMSCFILIMSSLITNSKEAIVLGLLCGSIGYAIEIDED